MALELLVSLLATMGERFSVELSWLLYLHSLRASEHISEGSSFSEEGVETGQKGACIRSGDEGGEKEQPQ